MVDFLLRYQNEIMFGCGIVNLMLAFFIIVIKFHSVRKQLALLKIELSVAVLAIGVSLTFHFDGDPSVLGFWVVRISNFCVFVALLTSLMFVGDYNVALFMESGKFERLPKRLLMGYVGPIAGISMVVINQFTGIYYTFDENNTYQRGPLFFVAFLFPFITIVNLFSFAMSHRKLINKSLVMSLALFSTLPIVAGIIQLFVYGYPLIEFASWLASVTLFWFALSDQNDEMSKAANTDLYTGLVNTYGYIHEADLIIKYHNITNYTAFYFDIVRMSYVNNKYGKHGGDEAIRRYANKLSENLEKDEILGRLGGNFFVALIKKTNVEKFIELLADCPIELEYHGKTETIHLKAVAGAYEVTKKTHSLNGGQLISYTATALAYAKNTVHKPIVYLDDQLQREFDHIREIEEKAVKGLRKKQFEPFYQPKIDTNGNILCGAEALARWRYDGKLVPPFEFIPVMEKKGSICDLDFYILEQVCQDIKDWLANGIEPVPVSVNFSRKNLGNPILAEAISKVVERYEIPKKYIQIEVTETIDEFPMSYLIGVVDALQRYGMTVAIDDFGTGSSSIRLLKDVKFDVMKIDKSFVDYTNEKDKALLGDIIAMAKNRDISVIAEGVEDAGQVESLKTMECYAIQGYIFDKPLEKKEFERRLANKQYKPL